MKKYAVLVLIWLTASLTQGVCDTGKRQITGRLIRVEGDVVTVRLDMDGQIFDGSPCSRQL